MQTVRCRITLRACNAAPRLRLQLDRPILNHTAADRLRPDIQGLRGVAVLLVVLYHAGVPFLPGGYVGVDVFFVISGYLITGLLVREVETHGRIDLPNFIARRARRLLPAAIALIVLVVVASVLIYPPLERTDIVAAARAAAVYAANLWFTSRAVDYLGGDAAVNPMLHMWSLGVEEQFYLLWPLMVGLAATRLRGGTAARRIAWMTVLVSVVTFVACVWLTRRSQPWAFFVTPFRAWEFGLGAIAYLARPCLQRKTGVWLAAAGWGGVAAIAASALILGHATLFPGPWALLPAAGTALVLGAIQTPASGALRGVLAFRPLARAGDVSYSWYLWHWPLLVMAPVVLPQAGVLGTLAAVAMSYLAAEASYRWIEQPFRAGRLARAKPQAAVLAALSTTVALAGLLTLIHARTVDAPVSAQQQLFMGARQDVPAVYAKGCHVPIRADEAKACQAGDPSASRVAVLFGDSHAAHWYPALDDLGAKQGWRIVSITKSACPWVNTPMDVEQGGFRRPYRECEAWRTAALKSITAMRPALVILASGSRYAGVDAAGWESGASRTLRELESSGASILILRDTPWPGFNVPTCLARAEHRGADPEAACDFSRADRLALGEHIFEAEKRAATGRHGVTVADLSNQICQTPQCQVLSGGVVHFSDHSHLSASFSRSLSRSVEQAMQRATR